MTCETDESVFDQMKQRHYDREEDDDLELLDPPLFLKLRKEGKLKRSKSFINGVNPSSQRIKPLFRFSSFAKVQPIQEVVVEDDKRSSATNKYASESLLKGYDSQLFKLPQLSQDASYNLSGDNNSNSSSSGDGCNNDEDAYMEYDEHDPFSYMTDTLAFVTRKSPSPTPTPTLVSSPSPTTVALPSSSAATISPSFTHAQDYTGTPRTPYSLQRPTFSLSSSVYGTSLGSSSVSSPSVFGSRSNSMEYSSSERTPGSLSSTPAMLPVDGGDPATTTTTTPRLLDGVGADDNPLSLKYKPFSYYT